MTPSTTRPLTLLALCATLGLGGVAPVPTEREAADACGPLQAVSVGDDVLCVKVDHEPPPTLTAGDGEVAAPIPDVSPACLSDGRDGFRVRVLYVHEEGRPDDLGAIASRLRRETGRVDWTVRSSAARDGGYRSVRWVTESAGDGTCRVAVSSVGLPAADLADFDTMVEALATRGYDRPDRRYLLFVARNDYCGIGTLTTDDRSGVDNDVHTTTGYARVDRPCWFLGARGGHSTAAHELFHTLGAVQASAPNATSLGHCTDEWDPMCYPDADDVRMTVRCEDDDPATRDELDRNNRMLDCGADDYFNASPPAGSYLATHWNSADAAFLTMESGDGPGHAEGVPDRPADPDGRPWTWPADRGTWRPSLAHGSGFEACDLPVALRVRGVERTEETDGSPGVLGLFGSPGSSTTTVDVDPELQALADELADRINTLAGTGVLARRDATTTDEPATGELVLDQAAGPARATVWTTDTRIERARVVVDETALSVGRGRDEALRVTLHALGVAETAVGDALTSRAGGADDRGTRAALAHLYAEACGEDPRLDVRAPGHPAQSGVTGTRRRMDVARDATTPGSAAVATAAWLRSRQGEGWARTTVLCRDDVFADCLAGSALLGDGGVILLVPGGPDATLPATVRDELDRTAAPGGRIVLLGGTGAVSASIERELRDAFPRRAVERIQGADRYATASAIAGSVPTEPGGTVLLARGDDPADAVAAGAFAARTGTPVLLTPPDRLVDAAARGLENHEPDTVVLLGGAAALGSRVAAATGRIATTVRVAGPTRTGTAAAIARSPHLWNRDRIDGDDAVVGVGAYTATSWQLAMVAAGVGAVFDAPLLYVTPDVLPRADRGGWDTYQQLTGLPVTATGDVTATSLVVGARLAGVSSAVVDRFHALQAAGVGGAVTVLDASSGLPLTPNGG